MSAAQEANPTTNLPTSASDTQNPTNDAESQGDSDSEDSDGDESSDASMLGDLFWPDNPHRKERVQQLYDDLKFAQAQLLAIKQDMTNTSTQLQPRLDACMKAMGLATFDDLEKRINETLSDGDLQKWKAQRAQMDKDDKIEGTIFGVVSVLAAGVGVVGLAISFVIPPLGSAIMAVAGVIELAEAAIQAIVNVIEGKEIRDKCRAEMKRLYPQRIETWVAYEQMLIMQSWLGTVNNTMASFESHGMTEQQAAQLLADLHVLSDGLVAKYDQMDADFVMPILGQMDTSRKAWTKEDPVKKH